MGNRVSESTGIGRAGERVRTVTPSQAGESAQATALQGPGMLRVA